VILASGYVKDPDNELCTVFTFDGLICCCMGLSSTKCVHPSTCCKSTRILISHFTCTSDPGPGRSLTTCLPYTCRYAPPLLLLLLLLAVETAAGRRQCLCCFTFCALPCDEEVPCGCAVCGKSCKSDPQWVDPQAYKSLSLDPQVQAMAMNRDGAYHVPESEYVNMDSGV
jgi:hypothetical protein